MSIENKSHLVQVKDLLNSKGITAQSLCDDPDIAVAIHFHTEMLDCNTRFCELTGYSCDEVIGARAWLFLEPKSIEDVLKQLNILSETPYIVNAVKKGGTPLRVEITGRNIELAKGMAARAVFVREL